MPKPLYLLEWPGTYSVRGCVEPRAVLDGCGKPWPHRNSIPGPTSLCIDWAVLAPNYNHNHHREGDYLVCPSSLSLKLKVLNVPSVSRSWVSKYLWQRTTTYWQLFRGPQGKNHISGIPNRLNYCVVFIAYAQFINVAAIWRPIV